MFALDQSTGTQADRKVVLEDQTLREAFQAHHPALPIEKRLELLDELIGAGIRRFQIGSLVRPDLMPQMADTERLYEHFAGDPGLEPWVLVFNDRGLDRALEAGVKHVALSASLSEMHSERNLGCSVRQALSRCRDLARAALEDGLEVRMGLQCAFGGPMLHLPPPKHLANLLLPFKQMGVKRLALCDTAGRAGPKDLFQALSFLRCQLPGTELGLHLHGQPEQLYTNLEAAWDGGVDWLDVTLNGRGGCPFLSDEPPDNLSTLAAVEFLAQKGIKSKLKLKRLRHASDLLEKMLVHSEESLRL